MKKKKSLMLIALLLLVGATSGYVASTYAKYTSEITGNNGTATVAKWSFEDDNTAQTLTINLAETYDATTLVANKIAPGTAGSFNIALSNENSEVGVDFVVALTSITNKPTNLKFYKTRSGSAGAYTYSNEITPGTTEITGQLAAEDSTGLNVPIYWVWAYETTETATNDPIDTANGEDTSANRTLTIGVTITGTQTPPSATAITSHVN